MADFTTSRLLRASGSQSNSSSSMCRPSACTLPSSLCLVSAEIIFRTEFCSLWAIIFSIARKKSGFSASNFSLAFLGRAATMSGVQSETPRTTRRSREEARRDTMGFRPVTKAAGTAGTAEGATPLNAFDNALLAAGIGNINLVRVSSILPPGVELVPLPRIKPGAIVPTAFASMTSEVPGEVIAAAVGWARPVDPAKNGVIMEFHDKATRDEAERMIVQMLEEAFRVRGEPIRDMQIFAVEHRVERTGCALAAVTLLGEDDLQ